MPRGMPTGTAAALNPGPGMRPLAPVGIARGAMRQSGSA